MSLSSLSVGDYLWVRAYASTEFLFQTTKIWANIVNVYGQVKGVQSGGFQFRPDGHGSDVSVTYQAGMYTNDEPGEPTLALNQHVQVLGIYQPVGSILTTRMWTV